MSTNSITKESIHFSNNQQSTLVFAAADSKPENIIKELEIKDYKAVILILGGADSIDEKLKPRLIQLFERGIARAAAEANAVIIDGGTQAGVMSLIGAGVASRGHKSTLIGVAPAGLISYPGSKTATGFQLESNHSHFVLVEGDKWNSKTEMMLSLVKTLSDKTTNKGTDDTSSAQPAGNVVEQSPTLAILAGGGATTKNEVLYAVRQNLPLIVFEGSGGMADEIVEAWQKRATSQEDPLMAEIIEEGNLHFYSLNSAVKGIERLIIRELGIDKVLVQAWETFADYDHNAILQQKRFDKIQMAIIFLGVAGTALAIIQQVFAERDDNKDLLFPWNIFHYILILIPILLTVLITAANRFKQGTKWLLLRAGAESIKREIYRYRTKAMYYKDDPEQQLSKKVEDITLRTMRTEVNLSSLKPYDKQKGFPPYMFASKGGDDGFTSLTPDRYVEVRLGDQLNYFKKSALKLDKQLTGLYWLIFLIGGIGTFLAAIDYQIWIALTTSIVAACGTYLGYRQTENTLTKYNQAATDLVNIKTWWNALSSEEQAQQLNIDSLVEHTEQVLQSELDGWIQQMQNALAELRKGQEAQLTEKEEKTEPKEVLKSQPGKEKNNDETPNDKGPIEKDKPVEKPKAPETEDTKEPEEPVAPQPASEKNNGEAEGDQQDGKDSVVVIPPAINKQEDVGADPEENKS
jgi:SLOG in TRPM, prokaryote/SMODS and SLOG-associating 2TM effector domain 1/Protein of unknown function (DUF4231)